MPAGRVANHVKQSHDPNRTLRSHVVQSRSKKQNTLLSKHGLGVGRPIVLTKAQQAEELRRAVENTRA